jgi:hypothetical protein
MPANHLPLLKRLALTAVLGVSSILHADVLLVGKAADDSEKTLAFSLSGNSRSDVIGGTISLGDATYEITHVSANNLIGGQRTHQGKTEFVIFSSSFSPVTATGQPWVASEKYIACDQEYNSFLALYRVDDSAEALPQLPFRQLAESEIESEQSAVFCFISAPEDR